MVGFRVTRPSCRPAQSLHSRRDDLILRHEPAPALCIRAKVAYAWYRHTQVTLEAMCETPPLDTASGCVLRVHYPPTFCAEHVHRYTRIVTTSRTLPYHSVNTVKKGTYTMSSGRPPCRRLSRLGRQYPFAASSPPRRVTLPPDPPACLPRRTKSPQ